MTDFPGFLKKSDFQLLDYQRVSAMQNIILAWELIRFN